MNGADAIPTSELDEREALRESIEDNEAELLDAVVELKAAVTRQIQLRERIAQHPIPWMAGGFLVGLWLSSRRR